MWEPNEKGDVFTKKLSGRGYVANSDFNRIGTVECEVQKSFVSDEWEPYVFVGGRAAFMPRRFYDLDEAKAECAFFIKTKVMFV